MKKTIGIIFADEMEFFPFLKMSESYNFEKFLCNKLNCIKFTIINGENETEVVAVESGIGKVNASFAAAMLAMQFNASYILNAGLSGAISSLVREDVLVCTSYVECDFDLTAIGYKLGEKTKGKSYYYDSSKELLDYAKDCQNVKFGAVGTGDIFLTDKVKKETYYNEFNILAFDMETGAIAAICDKFDLAFLSVRKISDDADDCSADAYHEMNNRAETCLSEILFEIIAKISQN